MFEEIVDKVPDLVGIELNDPINVDIAILYNKKIKENTQTYADIQKFIQFGQNFKNEEKYD